MPPTAVRLREVVGVCVVMEEGGVGLPMARASGLLCWSRSVEFLLRIFCARAIADVSHGSCKMAALAQQAWWMEVEYGWEWRTGKFCWLQCE